MRRFVFRLLLLVMVPFGLFASPATASKSLPSGCDVLANTGCDCISLTPAPHCLPVQP